MYKLFIMLDLPMGWETLSTSSTMNFTSHLGKGFLQTNYRPQKILLTLWSHSTGNNYKGILRYHLL